MTLTTYDEELCKEIEPNVSTTKERVEALKILRDEGIPTVVWLTPILPFINDTEGNIIGILNYCKEAKVFGITAVLRSDVSGIKEQKQCVPDSTRMKKGFNVVQKGI